MKNFSNSLCSIYKISNSINDKIYIGQTWKSINKRLSEHKNPSNTNSIKLYRALNKHGRDKFKIELITLCGTQEIADKIEIMMISQFNTIDKGYNIRTGGSRGKHSDKSIKKMSIAKIGHPVSEETKDKISLTKLGKTISKEQIINDPRPSRLLAKIYELSKTTILRIKRNAQK